MTGGGRAVRALVCAALAAGGSSCAPPESAPLPPDSFAFGVFGDAPYYPWERGPWRRVRVDAAEADLAFFVHIGDILWRPCSDEMYLRRRAELDAMPLPVIYTPGDNEWTDCHERRPGGYAPLDRLASLRRIFFDDPGSSLGAAPIPLTVQSSDPAWAEFPENVRWFRGGAVFATLHLVGSTNGMDPFEGRTAEDDRAAGRRTEAAVAWLREAFERAREVGAWGVVLFAHADLGFGEPDRDYGHDAIIAVLRDEVAGFPGQVLYAHGDSHEFIADQPLTDAAGTVLENFTRLETMGSPDVGWVRVVADTASGLFVDFEPRRMRGYW